MEEWEGKSVFECKAYLRSTIFCGDVDMAHEFCRHFKRVYIEGLSLTRCRDYDVMVDAISPLLDEAWHVDPTGGADYCKDLLDRLEALLSLYPGVGPFCGYIYYQM